MKQAIIVRKDLKLSKGKMSAQVAHASVKAYKNSSRDNQDKWEETGSKKIVVYVNAEDELLQLREDAKRLGISTGLIKDAGLTEIPAGTITCLGLGPAEDDVLDRITSNLSLV